MARFNKSNLTGMSLVKLTARDGAPTIKAFNVNIIAQSKATPVFAFILDRRPPFSALSAQNHEGHDQFFRTSEGVTIRMIVPQVPKLMGAYFDPGTGSVLDLTPSLATMGFVDLSTGTSLWNDRRLALTYLEADPAKAVHLTKQNLEWASPKFSIDPSLVYTNPQLVAIRVGAKKHPRFPLLQSAASSLKRDPKRLLFLNSKSKFEELSTEDSVGVVESVVNMLLADFLMTSPSSSKGYLMKFVASDTEAPWRIVSTEDEPISVGALPLDSRKTSWSANPYEGFGAYHGAFAASVDGELESSLDRVPDHHQARVVRRVPFFLKEMARAHQLAAHIFAPKDDRPCVSYDILDKVLDENIGFSAQAVPNSTCSRGSWGAWNPRSLMSTTVRLTQMKAIWDAQCSSELDWDGPWASMRIAHSLFGHSSEEGVSGRSYALRKDALRYHIKAPSGYPENCELRDHTGVVDRDFVQGFDYHVAEGGLLRPNNIAPFVRTYEVAKDIIRLNTHLVEPLYETHLQVFGLGLAFQQAFRRVPGHMGSTENPKVGALVDSNVVPFHSSLEDFEEAMRLIDSRFPALSDYEDHPNPLPILSPMSPNTCNLPAALAEAFKDA